MGYAIEVVSTKSNSKICKVKIQGNHFTGALGDNMGEKQGLKIFLALCSAKVIHGEDVANTELSDVLVTDNTTCGEHRISVYICGAMLENRPSEQTKGHIHFANTFLDGWCRDLGGNTIDENLKKQL